MEITTSSYEHNVSNSTDLWKEHLTPQQHVGIGVYLSTVGILAIIGNVLVLVVFSTNRHLRTPTNLLLVCLAVTDLTMACFGFPFAAVSCFANRWLFGRLGCLWYGFGGLLLGYGSIGMLTIISVDRYVSICNRSLDVSQKYNYYTLLIGCVWLNATAWSVMPLFGWGSFGLEPGKTACTIAWWINDVFYVSYVMTVFFICFVLPLCVMTACYYKAIRFIAWVGDGGRQENLEWTNEKDITKMSLACIILFFTAWSPYAIICLWSAFGDPYDIPLWAATSPALFAKSSTFYNPIVYVATNRQFRKAFFALFKCSKETRNNNSVAMNIQKDRITYV